MEAQSKALTDRMDAADARFAKLEASIEGTPDGAPARPLASGSTANFAKTDC
ncbi:hypothetical protein [Novosphingopyxis sp. YJ-S2-01]|uniref:hypothetical protein n=1 Tax=Novosphingopyxis sp. YJ-S2-01 TaxID=2794021 RepID=UPI0018DE16E1|nr:hypothetical protein [Novosphingopyxis sp. YJ-S2-01]MBH9536939.1 hypothetical protein [Novosphingopyxis sp. YJ-S2-01]